jgi:hypothetical protein
VATELKNYNSVVERHVNKLIAILKESQGQKINCSKLMDDLVFDMLDTKSLTSLLQQSDLQPE